MPANTEELVAVLLRSSVFLTTAWVIVWCLLRLFKLRSAHVHAVAWLAVLIQGAVLIPIPIRVPVPTGELGWPLEPPLPVEASSTWTAWNESPDLLDEIHSRKASDEVSPTESAPFHQLIAQPMRAYSLADLIAGCWLAGVIGGVALMFASYIRFIASLAPSRPVPPEWQTQWVALLARCESRVQVHIHVTEEIGPAICWTPSGCQLLIPEGPWSLLSPVQRELVLRHELAHLQRGDLWKALVYRLIAALQWFNPLAWLTVRKLAECAEWSCDDFARSSGDTDSAEYVRALLEFSMPSHGVPSLVPTAAGHSLVRRAERLLTPTLMEDSRMKTLTLALAVAALAIMNLVPLKLVAQEAPAKEPAKAETPAEPISTPQVGTATPKADASATDPQVIHIVTVDPVQRAAEPSPAKSRGSFGKEAVIDMAYIFTNLPQFKEWRDKMTKEIAAKEESMKVEALAIQALTAKITTAQKSDADKLRTEIATRTATLEVESKLSKQKFTAMESELYLQTYKLVRKAVAAYAKEHGIQIVRRTSGERDLEGQLDSGDPQSIHRVMNATIVYLADENIDITDEVLERLKSEAKAAESKTP